MANCIICGNKIGMFDEKLQKLDGSCICANCLWKVGISTAHSNFFYGMGDSDARAYIEKRHRFQQIFTPTDTVEHFIEVDENNRLIRVYYGLYGAVSASDIAAIDEIVGFDIVEDGMTVTKGGLGSAVAGGLLFGKTGAIAGAALGQRKTKDVCSSLNLIIILKGSHLENLTIPFLRGETNRHSAEYVSAQQMAKKCIRLLERITEDADEREPEVDRVETGEKTVSIVDEILRFKQLLDDGIITEEEFNFQKRKLLGMPN